MIAGTGEIRIRESDSTMRAVAENIAQRGLAVDAKKESRLRIHIRVAPAVQNDPGDIPTRIEAEIEDASGWARVSRVYGSIDLLT